MRQSNLCIVTLANDGLLPPVFGEIDSTGNPRKGALIAGELIVTIFVTSLHQLCTNLLSLIKHFPLQVF